MLRFHGCPELVLRAPSGALVEAVEARGPLAPLLGLAWLAAPPRRALVIPRCRSIHTWGMRFAIDIVFLAPEGHAAFRVVAVRPDVAPRGRARVQGGGRTAALELPAGASARLELIPGRTLAVVGRSRPRRPRRRQSTTGATAAGAGRTNTRWPTS